MPHEPQTASSADTLPRAIPPQNAPALPNKNSAKVAHDILDDIVARTPSSGSAQPGSEQGAPLTPQSRSSPGSPGRQGRSSRETGISRSSSRGRFLGRQNSLGAAMFAEDALDELARSIENAMEVTGEEAESSGSSRGRGKLGHHAARLARKHDLVFSPFMGDNPATGGALSPRSMDQGMRYLQEKAAADRNGSTYSVMRLEQLNPGASLEVMRGCPLKLGHSCNGWGCTSLMHHVLWHFWHSCLETCNGQDGTASDRFCFPLCAFAGRCLCSRTRAARR